MVIYDSERPYRLSLTVGNRLGIHARPSTDIQTIALDFQGKIYYCKEGNDPVDATSVIQVLIQGSLYGDNVHFEIFPEEAVSTDNPRLRETIAKLENIVRHDDDK
ncbi:hypothetical protein COU60_01765 [Candidatus Pacearchaeota archaeon CG10_big_fil_rev_8_21_14_0_10_34_76]|nr:MAG: hypothetical protein COU60_01765 [Candidatus Pacearchaeota archaeon CG10_big_fil_rev_8_21_14_0_10_34_76]